MKGGLATLIATILHEGSITLAEQEAARLADVESVNAREKRRAELVAASAAQVTFQAAVAPRPQPPLLRAL